MTPLLLCILVVAPFAQQLAARTVREPKAYYVATSGDDAGDGTSSHPFRTIQHGVDALSPGDSLTIAGGVYRETVKLSRSGNYFGRELRIKAADGESVVLDAEGLASARAVFDTNGCDHLSITGLTVRNGSYLGFEVVGSYKVTLAKCRVESTAASGIHVDKSHFVTVEGCEVAHSCRVGEESVSIKRSANVVFKDGWIHDTGHEGLDVKEGSRHIQVLRNRIDHVERQGLYADAWDSDTYDIRFDGNIVHDCMMGLAACTESGGLLHDVQFVNNVIYDCKGPGMILAKWGHESMTHRIRDVVFANNTVVNCCGETKNGRWGGGLLLENDQAENITVINNILSENPLGQLRIDHLKLVPKRLRIRNNLLDGPTEKVGRGNVFRSPQFVDPATKDFRLAAGSPGIDSGTVNAWAGDHDAAGAPRVQGRRIDLGALESAADR